MSFATLSGTLEECSLISKLELTKNPFDSEVDDRLNHALSSPSIFTKQETPGSQKKGFRWSIDQISKLNPADIDEFPNQEYSSIYERPEDETRAQEAINEHNNMKQKNEGLSVLGLSSPRSKELSYFSHNTILPSPWTPDNHVKHVTFSPLPPSTAYISGDEESMTDISHNSSHASGRKQIVDAVCQTTLTFPPSFDLTKVVDSGFYSYVEDESCCGGRELNVSSLRRKLFSQDDSGSPFKPVVQQSPKERVTRSILKSPSPKNLLTSSPYKSSCSLHPDLDSPFSSDSRTSPSPGISPIKPPARPLTEDNSQDESVVKIDTTLSNDDVFASNILESSDICINPSLIPDVSPIKGSGAHDRKTADQCDDVFDEEHDKRKSPEKKDEPDDGGPMKLTELCDVKMDSENDDENNENNNSKMDIAELQPLITTQNGLASHRLISGDDAISGTDDAVVSGMDDDVIDNLKVNDDNKKHELIGGVTNDVIPWTNDDAILDNAYDVIKVSSKQNTSGAKGTRKVDSGSKVGINELISLERTDSNNMDNEGYLRQRREIRDSWESMKENVTGNVYGASHASRMNGDKADEELIKRASAAMKRADKVVQETCMEQGTVPKKTGTRRGFLNWSNIDGTTLWHPIDMSTPVVDGKIKNKPLVPNITDMSSHRFRQLSDLDSYNNLVSSFANSRLDQVPRSYCPAAYDSELGTVWSSENCSKSRGRSVGLELRRRRSWIDIRSSASLNTPRDVYSSGRYGYNGTLGKRYSWPPWETSRSRYHYGRSGSPTIPSIQSRRRPKSADERSKTRRLHGLEKFTKPFDHNGKYVDYFDGMHSNSRKTYCR